MLRALYLALVFAPLPAATQDFDAPEETLRKLAAFAAKHGLRLEGCPGGDTFRDASQRPW